MEEKRKNIRYFAKLNLEVSSLFKQDNIKVENLNAPITVTDISKGGIGFRSTSTLPLGYYFNACLQLNECDDSKLFCVVKIIRVNRLDDTMTAYGCEFVGMAPVLSYLFDDYAETAQVKQ